MVVEFGLRGRLSLGKQLFMRPRDLRLVVWVQKCELLAQSPAGTRSYSDVETDEEGIAEVQYDGKTRNVGFKSCEKPLHFVRPRADTQHQRVPSRTSLDTRVKRGAKTFGDVRRKSTPHQSITSVWAYVD